MSHKGLNIYNVNTRSIHNKITQLQTLYSDVDILCCTETWLDNRLIICVYKPPTGKIENCIVFIKQILSDPIFSKREIWILGDFNTH